MEIINIKPNATDGLNTLIMLHIFKEPYLFGLLCTFQPFLMIFNDWVPNIGLFSDSGYDLMCLKIVGISFILKFTVNEIPALYDLMQVVDDWHFIYLWTMVSPPIDKKWAAFLHPSCAYIIYPTDFVWSLTYRVRNMGVIYKPLKKI